MTPIRLFSRNTFMPLFNHCRRLSFMLLAAASVQLCSADVLSRTGWVASSSTSGGDAPANALDGNPSTRWSTGTSQAPGQWFQVDMGAWTTPTFTNIILDATASPNDYPRGYQVYVSNDTNNWGSIVTNGTGSSAVTSISFSAKTGRYIRIIQTGSASGTFWSIHEFNVYGTRLPGTVSGLNATAGNARVSLSWKAATDATTYNVKRSTTSGSGYAIIASGVASTSYVDTAAANATTYYYVVSGVNGGTEGTNSAEVSASPTWPTIYTNSISGNWNTVTWQPNPPGKPTSGIFTTNIFNNGAAINSVNDMGSFTLNQLIFANQTVNLSGDALVFDGLSPLATNLLNNSFTVANNLTLNQNTTFGISANTTTLSGSIGGVGNLIKTGAGNLAVTGTNTYTGSTVVTNGILTVSSTGTLGAGDLIVASGTTVILQNTNALVKEAYVYDDGVLNLNFAGTNTIDRLYIGGVSQPAGVWNAARDATHFSGTGSLKVTEQKTLPDINSWLDGYNVSWNTIGTNSMQSMPIGNGDVGLNVWTETNGDLVFYIGKSDAWSDDVVGDSGLMKVGGVRVSLNPRPAINPFLQVLKVRTSEILVQENDTTFRVWVDANNPVIRVEVTNATPRSVTVALNNTRSPSTENVTMSGQANRVVWYHRNLSPVNTNVANLTFGAAIVGSGLVNSNDSTLVSSAPVTSQLVSVYPLTAKTAVVNDWVTQLNQQVTQVGALDLEQTRTAHQVWWDQFWHRSWVFVRGDTVATNTTQGYILQRFVTASAGRGAYPIKFNGSIFIVDHPELTRNADSRAWGGQYWFQNTRAMYWPRLMAGDFDIMQPLFRMYANQLPGNAAQVTGYYGHGGAYFQETAPFWGGLPYMGPEVAANYTAHYFTPILELSMMMLDYYDYTGDATFAQNTLVPVASAGLQFFDEHFGRDAQGKLLLDPDNSIEMFWKVHDPAPDIAGLRAVLPRMIALPTNIVTSAQRAAWTALLNQVPPLPTVTTNGKTLLLPYTGVQTNASHNGENPELYSIYPFRLYGLDRSAFQVALDSFNARKQTQAGCWVQDPIQAAMVGLADEAQSYVTINFTQSQDPVQKFPAFWEARNDYAPDEDNGGNGENGLQQMILQINGKTILLLPAWPAGWSGDFKLHAPFNTTVQGTIVNGKLTDLDVLPRSRKADVIDMSSLSSSFATGYNVLSSQDSIIPVKQTAKGGTNILAVSGVDFNVGESIANAVDGNLATKHYNKSQDGANAPGVNSGFVVTPALGATVIKGFQFATANDVPDRDPMTITIEGSNDPNAGQAGGGNFTLLYEGTSGLLQNSDRNAWGLFGNFTNNAAYKTYRVLITGTAGGSDADGVQYSEVQLMGVPQSPLPGTNILSTADAIIGVKQTSQGNPNVLAISGTDFSSTESATNIKDGNLNSKYYNTGQDGINPRGINTGFVITPQRGFTIIDGIQIATANDVPDRDPLNITIEGSNDPNAGQAGGNGFVPIWEGPTSLAQDPGRTTWGTIYSFINSAAYKTYRVLITAARGSGGGVQYSEVKLIGRTVTTPAAPIGLSATAGDAQVALKWNAVDIAASYNVKRSTISGSGYLPTANVAATNFTDTSVANGTLYYYVVSATNAVGESGNSAQVSAQPVSHTPPVLATAVSGGQLQFSWPTANTGWRLEVQTNPANLGLGTNWVAVTGLAATNFFSAPINSSNGSVFYRLIYP